MEHGYEQGQQQAKNLVSPCICGGPMRVFACCSWVMFTVFLSVKQVKDTAWRICTAQHCSKTISHKILHVLVCCMLPQMGVNKTVQKAPLHVISAPWVQLT